MASAHFQQVDKSASLFKSLKFEKKSAFLHLLTDRQSVSCSHLVAAGRPRQSNRPESSIFLSSLFSIYNDQHL